MRATKDFNFIMFTEFRRVILFVIVFIAKLFVFGKRSQSSTTQCTYQFVYSGEWELHKKNRNQITLIIKIGRRINCVTFNIT